MQNLVSNASADGSDAEVQGRNASVGGPLGCLYSERTGPVDGALCTLQILPYVAANIWRFDREWAIVGGMTTGVILLCCACCIYCACRCRSPYDDDKDGDGDARPPKSARARGTRGMRDQSDDSDGDNSEIGSPLGRIQPHRGSSAVCFRDSHASSYVHESSYVIACIALMDACIVCGGAGVLRNSRLLGIGEWGECATATANTTRRMYRLSL